MNYNIKTLQILEIKESFVEALNNSIKQDCVNLNEINDLSETLITSLNETATRILPPRTKQVKDEFGNLELWNFGKKTTY